MPRYVFSFIGERSPRYVRSTSLGSCRYSRRTLVTRLACLSCWRRINSYPHRCGDHCSAVQPLWGTARSSSLTHSHCRRGDDIFSSQNPAKKLFLGGKNVVTPYLVNCSFNLSNHNNLSMLAQRLDYLVRDDQHILPVAYHLRYWKGRIPSAKAFAQTSSEFEGGDLESGWRAGIEEHVPNGANQGSARAHHLIRVQALSRGEGRYPFVLRLAPKPLFTGDRDRVLPKCADVGYG